MKKKLILTIAAVAAVAVGVVGMSAFEAHIINVTAQIENALAVSTNTIEFGTVFPQEILHEYVCISLSQSFLDEDRVDDVKYVIKQKPKVIGDPYEIITVANVDEVIFNGPAHEYCLNNIPADQADLDDVYFSYCYPNLSPYLSKHKTEYDNYNPTDVAPYDTEVDAPNPDWDTIHAQGYLSKMAGDKIDHWDIDLVVPCFEGMCDQTYDPEVYGDPLDTRLEHKVFGTDLWIEVIDISEACIDC